MTRRRLLALSTLLFAVIGGAAFVWGPLAPRDAPAGQPPLAYLDPSSLAALRADFNAAAGDTRLIVLLAPT